MPSNTPMTMAPSSTGWAMCSERTCTCRMCLKVKPVENFYFYYWKGRIYTRRQCKDCRSVVERKYRELNKDKVIKTRKKSKSRPEYKLMHRLDESSRQARLNGSRNDFTKKQWEYLMKLYKHRCAYCNAKVKTLTQDHITPISRGGEHTISNIIPACLSCNSRKKDRACLKPVQPALSLA